MGVFAGRGVWNPLINVTCLWSKENTQMTSESGGALGKLGDVPHPGMLGLGMQFQLSVKLHILPKTKMSRGSASSSFKSIPLSKFSLSASIYLGLPPFSENMCGPGGIFCTRSGASGPLSVPTDGPRGPCLMMCCCAVHSSTLDWGRRTRLFLSPSTTWGSPKHSTCYSSISSHTLRTDCGVIGSRRVKRQDFVAHNYIHFFSFQETAHCKPCQKLILFLFFYHGPMCDSHCICGIREPIFQAMSLKHTWGCLTDMSR